MGISENSDEGAVSDLKNKALLGEKLKKILNNYVNEYDVQLNELYGVHVKDSNVHIDAMNWDGLSDTLKKLIAETDVDNWLQSTMFVSLSQKVSVPSLEELKRAEAIGFWKMLKPDQLDFLDIIGPVDLGVEKNELNSDDLTVEKVTPDNFKSAVVAGVAEPVNDSDFYTPTTERKADAISAIHNDTVDKLPSKLKRWAQCLVGELIKFLLIKLVVTMMCATPMGSNWLYAMEYTIPNETYSLREASGGKSLGNNYFMKVNAGTPVRIAAKKSSSKIIAYLNKGDTIRACERKGKWIRVEIKDTSTYYGWVSQSSVTHISLKGE